MITNQEVLDRNVQWFFREGNPRAYVSMGEMSGGCVYWSLEGKRCAIGCVLPEDAARTFQNTRGGSVINKLIQEYPAVTGEFFSRDQIPFLSEMQAAHDTGGPGFFHKDFGRALEKIALSNGLDLPPDFDELVALRSAQGGGK